MKNKAQHDHKNTTGAALPRPRPMPSKSSPSWKPQPCGLSREELREIVAQMMG